MLVRTLYRIAFKKLFIATDQHTVATNVRFTGFSACSALSHKKELSLLSSCSLYPVFYSLFSVYFPIYLSLSPIFITLPFFHTSLLQHHSSLSPHHSIFFRSHPRTLAWSRSTNNSHFLSIHRLLHISHLYPYVPTYRTYLTCLPGPYYSLVRNNLYICCPYRYANKSSTCFWHCWESFKNTVLIVGKGPPFNLDNILSNGEILSLWFWLLAGWHAIKLRRSIPPMSIVLHLHFLSTQSLQNSTANSEALLSGSLFGCTILHLTGWVNSIRFWMRWVNYLNKCTSLWEWLPIEVHYCCFNN